MPMLKKSVLSHKLSVDIQPAHFDTSNARTFSQRDPDTAEIPRFQAPLCRIRHRRTAVLLSALISTPSHDRWNTVHPENRNVLLCPLECSVCNSGSTCWQLWVLRKNWWCSLASVAPGLAVSFFLADRCEALRITKVASPRIIIWNFCWYSGNIENDISYIITKDPRFQGLESGGRPHECESSSSSLG